MGKRAYLDTHIVVWLHDGESDKLSARAKGLIEKRDLFISPFVLLELEYLMEIGRLAVEPDKIVEYLHERIGLLVCTLQANDIVREALHMSWTRDPFDRLITAHAAAAGSELITIDAGIRANYSRARF